MMIIPRETVDLPPNVFLFKLNIKNKTGDF